MKVFLLDELKTAEHSFIAMLNEAYPELDLIELNDPTQLDEIAFWNSLLVYRFDEDSISEKSLELLTEYKKKTQNKGSIFPISYGDQVIPPEILKPIKAVSINDENATKIISSRIGAFLGLICLGKDHEVFLSHRAKDGRDLTIRMEKLLSERGFKTWRDEARDCDNEGPIKLGTEAQPEIKKNLERCTVILLIDTPLVTESDWVRQEIEMANAELIPVLPICFRYGDDESKGPRFKELYGLNRWLDVKDDMFSEDEIAKYLEKFLLDIYKRKRSLPEALQKSFASHGFSWNTLDPKRLYFHSNKTISTGMKSLKQLVKDVLSHSPIHKGVYAPYVIQFSKFQTSPAINFRHRLLVYEGEHIHEADIDLLKNQSGVSNVDILHHQEIDLFLRLM